ncbi:MAG TPA: CHAT domain-containing tetratricopeptide repeat protein [Candidatus Koribacter sp.]
MPLALFCAAIPTLSQTPGPSCDLSYLDQPKPHLAFVDAQNSELSALLAKGYADPQKGKAIFEQALQSAKTAEDVCGEALAEYGIAAALEHSEVAAIESHLQKSIDLFSSIAAQHALAQAHYILGRVLQRSGKPKDGAAVIRQAAVEYAASHDAVHAIGAKVSAVIMESGARSDAEMEALLGEARAVNSKSTEASILHLWGDDNFSKGNFSAALDHYQQARTVFEECSCNNSALATVLVSMGRLERVQGQPHQALKDYELALKLQHAIGEEEYAVQTMNAMAVAYDAIGLRHESLMQYQRTLAQANEVGAKQFIPLLEGNIGGEYLKLGQWDSAARQLQMVLAKGLSDYQACIREGQLAEALLHLRRFEEAFRAADQGVGVCRKRGDRESLADALQDRAKVAGAQKRYDIALADIREGMTIREDTRSHLVPDDARKQGYNERIQDLYDDTIELLNAMGRHREALEAAESGRARAFLDLMGTQGATGLEHTQVAVDAPSFASYVSAPPFTADDMIAAARRYRSTLLVYWASDNALYIWTVNTEGAIHDARVAVSRKRLEQLVRATTETPKPPAQKQVVAARSADVVDAEENRNPAWRTLYDLLIAPVERYLPRTTGSLLTIIPHHELFRLSFAALTDAQGKYLIERHALHTVSAAGLLRYTQENDDKTKSLPPHFLLVANPSGVKLENNTTLPELPATISEVRSIARLLPASEVTSLAGAKAQETAITDALSSATVAHFATHAVLDDADPRQSFLLLSPQPGSTTPVRLTTADVYRLKLHTRIVVLSACRTGLGRITGDGIDGFSRAFFYAGTASFVATLWDVADQPTAMLLPRFYRELNAGKSRSQALRLAELDLIAALRAGKIQAKTALGPITLPESPKFWASFNLSGEP